MSHARFVKNCWLARITILTKIFTFIIIIIIDNIIKIVSIVSIRLMATARYVVGPKGYYDYDDQ